MIPVTTKDCQDDDTLLAKHRRLQLAINRLTLWSLVFGR